MPEGCLSCRLRQDRRSWPARGTAEEPRRGVGRLRRWTIRTLLETIGPVVGSRMGSASRNIMLEEGGYGFVAPWPASEFVGPVAFSSRLYPPSLPVHAIFLFAAVKKIRASPVFGYILSDPSHVPNQSLRESGLFLWRTAQQYPFSF